MPTPTEILRQLEETSHALAGAAIAWHVVLAVAIVALLARWRPSQRVAIAALGGPAISVALAAAAHGSPFNALSFAALAALLALAAWRAPAAPVSRGPAWATAIGAAALAYGWIYPHFVDGGALRAVIAAPIGLVPCPSLAVLAGLVLVGGGLGSRTAVALVATWAAFYAAFGVVRLGVALDVGLAGAALALAPLLVTAAAPGPRRPTIRPGRATA